MSDAALAALARYRRAAQPGLPTEPGLWQATIHVRHRGGLPALRPMAKVGIDFDGRWFEYYRCEPRQIAPEDVVLETLRAVDWSVSPEVRMDCLQSAR